MTLYILIIYKNYSCKELIYMGLFSSMKDIFERLNHIITYADIYRGQKQKTILNYKDLFKIYKIKKI